MAAAIVVSAAVVVLAERGVDVEHDETERAIVTRGALHLFLEALLERPNDVVARDELRERLWPADTFVDFDNGLNNAVNKVRRVLGDSAAAPSYIETVGRRGYRFIGTIDADLHTPPIDRLVSRCR